MRWKDEDYLRRGLQPPPARRPIPGHSQDVAGVLDHWAEATPEAEALVGRYARYSYRQLDARVGLATKALLSLGLQSGQRMAFCGINDPEVVVAFLACQRLGAIWVGINRNYAAQEKRYFLTDSAASLLICDRNTKTALLAMAAPVEELPRIVVSEPSAPTCEWAALINGQPAGAPLRADVDPMAPAAIAYTSGTSGFPKGAVHSQHNMMVAATVMAEEGAGMGMGSRRASALLLTILNLMVPEPLQSFVAGGAHICMDRMDAQDIAEWISREQVTSMSLVPTIVRAMLDDPMIDPRQLDSLSGLVVGAAPVPPDLAEIFEARFGFPITIGYGLTENLTGVARTRGPQHLKPGCVGTARSDLHIAILSEDDEPLPQGSIGEICVRATDRGPWADVYMPALGYWQRPADTAALLRGGWLHTGDEGYLDSSGALFIAGRRSEVIIRGGANVYPAEVERIIERNPAVRAAAVVGRPDARLGEIVVAFVEAVRPEAWPKLQPELAAQCAESLARYKVPAEWVLVTAFPRNAMNKIVKRGLLAGMADASPGASA